MPVAPYDPYAIANPWWRQQQAQQAFPFSQPQDATARQQQRNASDPPDSTPATPGQPSSQRPQPSLYDMMLNLGRMTRPQYDKAISGPGAYGISPRTAGAAGPWAFLGSLGLPGGPGWGGGTPG